MLLAFLVRVVCADTTSTGVLGVSGGAWGLGSVGRQPGPTDLKSFLRLCERHACNECCVGPSFRRGTGRVCPCCPQGRRRPRLRWLLRHLGQRRLPRSPVSRVSALCVPLSFPPFSPRGRLSFLPSCPFLLTAPISRPGCGCCHGRDTKPSGGLAGAVGLPCLWGSGREALWAPASAPRRPRGH